MRKNFNGKIIGKDVMELSDIQALTANDMKKYRIAVMTMELKGYEIETYCIDSISQTWKSIENPNWFWGKYIYRIVPEIELTPEQKLQNWIKENGVNIGDKVKHSNYGRGKIERFTSTNVCVAFYKYDDELYHLTPESLELIKPTYAELQAQWVKENDVKEGDMVKVLRKFEDGEFGYGASKWDDIKEMMIGKTWKIEYKKSNFICVNISWFPFQVLELVRPEIVPYTFEDFCRLGMQGKGVKRISDGKLAVIEYIKKSSTDNLPIRIQYENSFSYVDFDKFKDEFVWLNGEPCGRMV